MPVLRFVPPVMDRRSQEQQHQRSDPRAASRVGDPAIGTRSRLARFLAGPWRFECAGLTRYHQLEPFAGATFPPSSCVVVVLRRTEIYALTALVFDILIYRYEDIYIFVIALFKFRLNFDSLDTFRIPMLTST
jgi:hypothetical protein